MAQHSKFINVAVMQHVQTHLNFQICDDLLNEGSLKISFQFHLIKRS